MNIELILNGDFNDVTIKEQESVIEELKKIELFSLNEKQLNNVISFICEKMEKKNAIDYLFHVMDTEVSYPIDDDKLKKIFSNDKMKELSMLMLKQLDDEIYNGNDNDVDNNENDNNVN